MADLSDTVTCIECKGRGSFYSYDRGEITCTACFGRGYVTIRMLSEIGIRDYVKDKELQEQYITLQKSERVAE